MQIYSYNPQIKLLVKVIIVYRTERKLRRKKGTIISCLHKYFVAL